MALGRNQHRISKSSPRQTRCNNAAVAQNRVSKLAIHGLAHQAEKIEAYIELLERYGRIVYNPQTKVCQPSKAAAVVLSFEVHDLNKDDREKNLDHEIQGTIKSFKDFLSLHVRGGKMKIKREKDLHVSHKFRRRPQFPQE